MKRLLLLCLLIAFISASCTQPSAALDDTSLSLGSFTENDVTVSIRLDRDQQGKTFLSATFTPPEGYHLYSKNIPINGLDGLGRPTLLDLPAESQITAVSELTESIAAQVPDFEPRELLVYPAGEVTLSLQIELPSGNKWVDDSVRITYMACSASLCKPPVQGKIVPIHIPGSDAFESQ